MGQSASHHQEDGSDRGGGDSRAGEHVRDQTLLNLATDVLKARRRRAGIFGDDACLFGEPAWDILLDLYVQSDTRPISVSSACIAGGVPGTTALRCLDQLQQRGLIRRFADRTDKRRNFVTLSPRGRTLVEAWLRARVTIATSERLEQLAPQAVGELEWLQAYRSMNEMQLRFAHAFLHLLIGAFRLGETQSVK
jgi:DNA-binding MarR family transcriptional regulator